MNAARVALVRQERATYPERAPFHPGERYPELPAGAELDPANAAYGTVRAALLALGLDREHAGTAAWNPLGGLVRPGETVFIKPNMIAHRHRLRADEWDSVVTHGAVIRAVVDYVFLALRGEGAIWLGDAPQTDYIYEPDPATLLDRLLRQYLTTVIDRAFLESIASEHGARMTAMENATSNASEMIERLTLAMNRARQAAITTELMEIVSGAEALKG